MLYDADIREPLFLYLEGIFGKVRFLEEKVMGRSRADAVMVMENALCGIEIKSDADTYQRLDSQVQDYDHFFDYNLLVIGQRHEAHAQEHVPASWGILSVHEDGDGMTFRMLRIPEKSPGDTLARKLSMLWRPELNRLLAVNRMPHYTEKSKKFVASQLRSRVRPELLHRQISDVLFERDYTTIHREIEAFRAKQSPRRSRTARRKSQR